MIAPNRPVNDGTYMSENYSYYFVSPLLGLLGEAAHFFPLLLLFKTHSDQERERDRERERERERERGREGEKDKEYGRYFKICIIFTILHNFVYRCLGSNCAAIYKLALHINSRNCVTDKQLML